VHNKRLEKGKKKFKSNPELQDGLNSYRNLVNGDFYNAQSTFEIHVHYYRHIIYMQQGPTCPLSDKLSSLFRAKAPPALKSIFNTVNWMTANILMHSADLDMHMNNQM